MPNFPGWCCEVYKITWAGYKAKFKIHKSIPSARVAAIASYVDSECYGLSASDVNRALSEGVLSLVIVSNINERLS